MITFTIITELQKGLRKGKRITGEVQRLFKIPVEERAEMTQT